MYQVLLFKFRPHLCKGSCHGARSAAETETFVFQDGPFVSESVAILNNGATASEHSRDLSKFTMSIRAGNLNARKD